ncbi:hypothetical protein FQ087_13590 [Sporosarcina sp. ANT_H38]|uniref:hypothetical protein n=1 Tax=Sporosarcina sp. ANT_H38 TaxID=2597358 RepID=UPI0011F160F7|nr:hypothetical protein [Sporosarcina sp. ANT_H38]KAA0955630.1 hypothetical protein FQ087_13590 [Sporosarcina sp. ANT_H38]
MGSFSIGKAEGTDLVATGASAFVYGGLQDVGHAAGATGRGALKLRSIEHAPCAFEYKKPPLVLRGGFRTACG